MLVLAFDAQVFPVVLNRLGGTTFQQGLLLSSQFFMLPVSSAAAGVISDRFGKRAVLSTASAFLSLPFVLSALFQQLWARTLSVFLFGIGMGAVESQASAYLTDLFPGKERSIMNLSQFVFCVGAVGGPLVIAFAYKRHPDLDLSSLLWAVAAGTLPVAAGFALLREKNEVSPAFNLGGFKAVIDDRWGRLMFASMFFYVAPEMGTAGWITKYAEDALSLAPGVAPLALALYWGGLGTSRVVFGSFFHGIKDTHLLLFSLALALSARAGAFLAPSAASAFGFIFLVGFGMGCVWPTLVAMTGTRFRDTSGSAVGLVIAAGACAAPIMQQIIGVLSRDSIFGLRYTLMGLGIFHVASLAAVSLFRRAP
jgi:fucose permease